MGRAVLATLAPLRLGVSSSINCSWNVRSLSAPPGILEGEMAAYAQPCLFGSGWVCIRLYRPSQCCIGDRASGRNASTVHAKSTSRSLKSTPFESTWMLTGMPFASGMLYAAGRSSKPLLPAPIAAADSDSVPYTARLANERKQLLRSSLVGFCAQSARPMLTSISLP